MPAPFDRTREDVGNIVGLEHVNVTVPDQRLATLFYIVGLGFTRDPYLMVGDWNMWVNLGRHQFHLPTAAPQVLRGVVGVVVPDLDRVRRQLAGVAPALAGTRYAMSDAGAHLDLVCPWGNRIRCHAPGPQFPGMRLGMPYVEFEVPAGAADGIARFYREIFGAPARVADGVAIVTVGPGQVLRFRETTGPQAPYDGHHIAIYIADFSGPLAKLAGRGLVTRDEAEHEWRFQTIVDPATGAPLFDIEHEVRSLTNPLWARPLVNRNPDQSNIGYEPGRDAFHG